ncbi:MAG: hypothetical protein ACI8WB_004016 [Phenylobacterium sp.]|jgi:hypothetical protein
MVMVAVKIPDTLKQALQNRELVPFVGAGVSMSVLDKDTGKALFPSWRQLLLNVAKKLSAEQDTDSAEMIELLLKRNKENAYLEAAKEAKEALGTHQWNDFLRQQIDVSRSQCDSNSLTTAEKIWQLGSQLVITTNYDKVLDWSCPAVGRDDLTQWEIEASYEQQQALTKPVTRPTVWHLHGRISNITKLILTPDGYQTLYGDDIEASQYQAALASLKIFLATRTLLFIGFSFADEVFSQQLKLMNTLFDGNTPKHYVLVRENQQQSIDALKLPLKVITYQDHKDLPDVLTQLAACVDDVSETVEQIAIEAKLEPITETRFSMDNNVFNVPYREKGDGVVGREEVLLTLRQQLASGTRTNIGHAAAFRGMGGLGKTQLAVEYAYRYQRHYPKGVIWLVADQYISTQLIQLATKAQWISPHSEHKDILAIALRRLKNTSDCLIIFDNVDELEQINDYLPEVNVFPHLLITSRTDQLGFTPIQLELLTPEQSLELLFKEACREPLQQSDTELAAAKTIVTTLGHLPLALEIAGAYLKHLSAISFVQYQQLLADNLKLALAGKHYAGFTNHERDLYLTLQITDSQVSQAPLLKDILQLLSWSAPANMGLSLLAALLEVAESELFEPLAFGVELKLLTKSDDHQRYGIHRLLRQIQRDTLPLDGLVEWGELICQRMVDWFAQRRTEFNELAGFEAEMDHLKGWTKLAQMYHWPQCSSLIWLQSYPSKHWGNYKASETLLLQALHYLDDNRIENDKAIRANVTNDLGSIVGQLGHYKKALAHKRQALALRLGLRGEKHVDIADCYENIGNSHYQLGQYREALVIEQKALDLRFKLLGEEHLSIATSYNNIGSTYGRLSQHQKALEFKQKALKLWLELLGEKHPSVATSYNNIGGSYSCLDQHQKALEYKQKALLLWLELLGEKHLSVAVS